MAVSTEVFLGFDTKKYIRDIIAGSRCPLFFASSSVKEEGGIKVYFFTDGFLPLADVLVDTPFTGAKILTALVKAVQSGENYYLSSSDYVIDEKTVFVRMRNDDVKVKMIFRKAERERNAENPWEHITDYLLERQLREYPEYLMEARNILSRSLGYGNAVRRLELFKRKMYAL